MATSLAAARLKALKKKRQNRHLGVTTTDREGTLKAFAAHHLREKAKAGKVVEETLEYTEGHLRAAVEFFGAARDLRAIDAQGIRRWVEYLAKTPSGRGQKCPECGVPGAKTESAGDPDDPLTGALVGQAEAGVGANAPMTEETDSER